LSALADAARIGRTGDLPAQAAECIPSLEEDRAAQLASGRAWERGNFVLLHFDWRLLADIASLRRARLYLVTPGDERQSEMSQAQGESEFAVESQVQHGYIDVAIAGAHGVAARALSTR